MPEIPEDRLIKPTATKKKAIVQIVFVIVWGLFPLFWTKFGFWGTDRQLQRCVFAFATRPDQPTGGITKTP
jgi:hypothetical protein